MDELVSALERVVPLQGLLGYVNFAEGRPDARFQKQMSEAFGVVGAQGAAQPWQTLYQCLRTRLEALRQESSAFRDIHQAQAVLTLAFERLLPAYRQHHADLLAHCPDWDLFQPFFLARVCEAVLAQRGPWDEEQRIIGGALRQLNDYVGHRPIAILESRPQGEPYDHERFRPVPLYIQGAGVAWGTYRDLCQQTLEILAGTDPGLLQDAYFDAALLDELAMDVRGYDFHHPADKRPNYGFGEWDPHLIDNQGRYRRFVVRQHILDALVAQVSPNAVEPQCSRHAPRDEAPHAERDDYTLVAQMENGQEPGDEKLWEAAAVLAGTILMGSGVSGSGPATHDSSTTLANLVPRIARYRDAFYEHWLQTRSGDHGRRLREDAQRTRQPFGGIRQRLNQFMAGQRAWQLQQRHLALLFAEIGYAEAGRRHVAKIPVVSARLLTEIRLRLTLGQNLLDRGQVAEAALLLAEIENLLHRGIACGALVDPWNILGFQGQYPRFTALEDSVRDHRIDDLIEVVGRLFSLYARLLSDGAATGQLDPPLAKGGSASGKIVKDMKRLASWWDRFATVEVSDVAKVHGGEALASAEHVTQTLTRWRQRGEAAADLAFWRQHQEGFQSPKAFALVVEALLRKEDFRAAMALLMTWLSQRDQVPLQQDEHSFHTLALRWMLGICSSSEPAAPSTGEPRSVRNRVLTDLGSPGRTPPFDLIAKFFDYLEANAEEYWDPPRLDKQGESGGKVEAQEEEKDDLYSAAYEDVTYQDTTDDNVESEVLDFMPQKDFDLAAEAERLEKHLRFLSTLARLWNIATRAVIPLAFDENQLPASMQDILSSWLERARQTYQGLLVFLDKLHAHEIPRASGSYESLVEFDRRRALKERLLADGLGTCLETILAIGAVQGVIGRTDNPLGEPGQGFGWEAAAVQLERALWRGDAASVRRELQDFMAHFRQEPLLYVPLVHGGHPRQILRSSLAQVLLRALVANLPRLGLLRETFDLVRTAKAMEDQQSLTGPRVTEFETLFRLACQALVDAVVDSSLAEPEAEISPEAMVRGLETLIEPLMGLWIQHSKGLRVSVIESIASAEEWDRLRDFIQRYGGDLFGPRFMALGNLRGIFHQGVAGYLDYLQKNPDPLHPVKLLDELDSHIPLADAVRFLNFILQTVMENYAEYQDYKATTTQSDYGENLFQLFDFLRLKASYERNAWQLRPVYQVHEVLARRLHPLAGAWRDQVREFTNEVADDHLAELARLEQTHGMRLPTIADRLDERFVKPLEIDRVCALIEPALDNVRRGGPEVPLEDEIKALAETPTGVGLEVPFWLRRLESEITRVRQTRTAVAGLAENLYRIPKVVVPWQEVQEQLKNWPKDGKE